MSTEEKLKKWDDFVDHKNRTGIVIPLGDDMKNREIHIKPEGSIPSHYNFENVPHYRLMNRKERRK